MTPQKNPSEIVLINQLNAIRTWGTTLWDMFWEIPWCFLMLFPKMHLELKLRPYRDVQDRTGPTKRSWNSGKGGVSHFTSAMYMTRQSKHVDCDPLKNFNFHLPFLEDILVSNS